MHKAGRSYGMENFCLSIRRLEALRRWLVFVPCIFWGEVTLSGDLKLSLLGY